MEAFIAFVNVTLLYSAANDCKISLTVTVDLSVTCSNNASVLSKISSMFGSSDSFRGSFSVLECATSLSGTSFGEFSWTDCSGLDTGTLEGVVVAVVMDMIRAISGDEGAGV